MRALGFYLALAVPACAEPVIPSFTNETGTAGLSTVYAGDWEYMVGGGVASFDCSGDGLPEVFLAGGTGPSALYLNRSPIGGALAFEKTDAVTIDAVLGAYPLDIDSDGMMDLVVLRQGENKLLRGLGACRFEEANEAWGFDGAMPGQLPLRLSGKRGKAGPRSPSATTSTGRKRRFPGGPAPTTGCIGLTESGSPRLFR